MLYKELCGATLRKSQLLEVNPQENTSDLDITMTEVERIVLMISQMDLEGLADYADVDKPKIGRNTRKSLHCLFDISLRLAAWRDRSEERMKQILGGNDDTG